MFTFSFTSDERIILFEKERLRLRKALQSQTPSRQDARSVGTTENRSTSPAAISTTSGNKLNSTSQLPVPQATPGSAQASVYSTRTMGSQRNSVTPLNRSISGIQSTSANTTTGPLSQPQQIYAWEDGNERAERVPFDVGGVTFLPSKQVGFYNRQDPNTGGIDSTPLPERYVDFQIILSPEELTTLAARKKTLIGRVGLSVRAEKPSVHTSTPYVDPRRVHRDLLRPVNPDKWLSAEGLRPYKRAEKI